VVLVADGRFRAVGVLGNVGIADRRVSLPPTVRADHGLLQVAVPTPVRASDRAGLVLPVLKPPRAALVPDADLSAKELRLAWPDEVPVDIDGDDAEPR
jgi:hypothetical protein